MASRPVGRLLDLEYQVLQASVSLQASDEPVYGFSLARQLSETRGDHGLIGHGTLYKALGRMSKMGLLESEWEVPADDEGRPRRRLYRVTGEGAKALASRARSADAAPASRTALA